MWPGGRGEQVWWTHRRGSLVTVRGQMAEGERDGPKVKGREKRKKEERSWLIEAHLADAAPLRSTAHPDWTVPPKHKHGLLWGSVLLLQHNRVKHLIAVSLPTSWYSQVWFTLHTGLFSASVSAPIMVKVFCVIQDLIVYLSLFINCLRAVVSRSVLRPRPLFESLGLVSEWTAFLLGLVSVSDNEDSWASTADSNRRGEFRLKCPWWDGESLSAPESLTSDLRVEEGKQ